MTVTVLDKQTLLDIAIQTTGKAENFLQIAKANGMVPTAQPAAGTKLVIPQSIEKDTAIVNYFLDNNILPATAVAEEMTPELSCEEQLYECFKT